jgi:hypothetical protein
MSRHKTNSPFENAFSRAGLIKPPSPEIIAEAQHIEFSSNEIIKLLQDIIDAVPQVNLESVGGLVGQVQEVSDKLTTVLAQLVNPDSVAVIFEHQAKLKEAEELLMELRGLKGEIVGQLTREAGLNPATGPGEELAVLPIGEVLPNEPLLLTYDGSITPKAEDLPTLDVISTNLDPVTEVSDGVFRRPIGAVPPEEKVIMSDLETQQPRTPEEAEDLRLLRLYDEGSREVFVGDGKFKKLDDIKREIVKLFHLVGHTEGRINFILNKEIGKLTKEIFNLKANLVLEKKEKSKRLDEVYGQLLQLVQKNLRGREHRFVRPVSSISENPELNNVTPAQFEDIQTIDTNETAVANLTTAPEAKLDLSKVPTLNIDDIVPDSLLDKWEFKGFTKQEVPTNIPTLVDVVESPANLLVSDKTIPSAIEEPADISVAPIVSPENIQTPLTSNAVDILPPIDDQVTTTPEASKVEAVLSVEEAYIKERERYYSLRDSVYEKRLGLKFYYELDRAEIHIQTIDYVLFKYKDNDTTREQKVRDNVDALAKINARLAEGLDELKTDSLAPVPNPEPLPVLEPIISPEPDPAPEPITPPTPEPITLPIPPTPTPAPKPAPVATPPVPMSGGSMPIPVGVEPLMDSHVEAYKEASERADRLKAAGLTASRQFDTVPFKEREKMRGEYAKERTLAIGSRRLFKEAETNYQTKLKEFYENRGFLSKTGGAIRTFFGGKPKLPPELEKLQTIYKYTKEQYALQLRGAWEKRAGAFAGNKVLDEAKPTIKKAFAKKFVLEPRYRLLDIQAEACEKNDQNFKFKSVMNLMRKHKTALRWVGLGVAAGTGAAAGGAMIAGFNMARWGVSTFGGVALANEVYRRKEKVVQDAVSNLSLEKEKIEKEFTLAKLNDFDESLAFGSLEVERAKLKQKTYAVGAAVAFGGAINVGTSLIDTPSTNVETAPRANGVVTSENTNNLSADEAIRLAHEKRVLEIEQRVESIRSTLDAQKVNAVYQPPASPVTEEVLQNMDVTPETILQMRGVKVSHYATNGELLSQTSVSNIKLNGLSTDALREATLPQAKVIEIYSHLNYKVNDILAAHPNFSKVVLEKLLFNELQNIYGGEDWWTSAKINEVKIGSMVNTVPGAPASVPEVATLTADVRPDYSLKEGEAIASSTTKVADNSPVGSKAVPLTDQPYPFAKKDPIIYTRSGGLAIEQADPGISTVPIIKAIYNPVEVAGADTLSEALPPKEINYSPLPQAESTLLPPDPEKIVASGNYLQSPAFKEYVVSEYGGMDRFNKIVLRDALEVEAETYDIFNKWLNEYQSPYEMSLSKMTIGDLKEAFGGPELSTSVIEVDSTGLPKQYNTDAIRQYASANNFNYETVRQWLVKLEDLKKEFPHQSETTLEDLFARSIVKADLLVLKAKGISA